MNLSVIALLIVSAFCIVSFFYFKWYIKNRTGPSGVLKETRSDVRKWINEVNLSIAEVNAVTDRNLSLIEDRINKLNEILEETDKRISVYVKEVEKSRSAEALYTQLGRGVRAAVKTEPVSQIAPQPAPQPAPQSLFMHNDNTKAEPSLTSEKNKSKPVKNTSKEQTQDAIDRMVKEGLQPEVIAKKLKISIGEVDLAVQLLKMK